MHVKQTLRSLFIVFSVFVCAVLCSLVLQKLDVQEHITTIFVFAVFLISLFTEGYVYGVVSALAGTLAVNYIFTYPYFSLNFSIPANLISAVVMVTVAVLTGTLTTKIKRTEAMKAQSERERTRANLLRAVSHDLRTPLTTIYGASTTLREKRGDLTEEQKDAVLRSIQEDAEWLIRMVENLLSVTGIDSEKMNLRKTPTVIDELIDSVMSKCKKRYPQAPIQPVLPDSILIVPMDALLIEQVLFNLLENAVLHAQGMTELTLRVYQQGKQAVFEVADNGCGVSPERLQTLFSGGEGAASCADGRKRNTGIGLSVCAAIVQAHGGKLTAKNRPGGGMVFRFALDCEEMSDDEQ